MTTKGTWPSVDHSFLSPSGHISKRARAAYLKRFTEELFGDCELRFGSLAPQPSAAERLLQRASELRGLAARGMSRRKFTKEAERLEAAAANALTTPVQLQAHK